MSKQNKETKINTPAPITTIFGVERINSGFVVVEYKIQSGNVISKIQVTPEDVFSLMSAQLARLVRKELGL